MIRKLELSIYYSVEGKCIQTIQLLLLLQGTQFLCFPCLLSCTSSPVLKKVSTFNSFTAKFQTTFIVCFFFLFFFFFFFFFFNKLSLGKKFICKVERLNVKQRISSSFCFFNKLSLGKKFICKIERLNVKQRRSR